MPVYYTPGVYFERIDSGQEKIPGIRTDIPGFVGIAEKGPLHKPVRLESWKQFQSVFGGFIPQSYLAYAVHGFFENRGETCYVVRIADTDSAKKAEGILLDKNGKPTFKVFALNEGQWGNQIKVSLKESSMGTTDTAFLLKCKNNMCNYIYDEAKEIVPILMLSDGWACPKCQAPKNSFEKLSSQPTDRDSSIVKNLVGFEKGSLVKITQKRNETLVEKYHCVDSVDVLSRRIVWDKPLEKDTVMEKGFDLDEPIRFRTMEFMLTFSLGQKLQEIFKNLSLQKDHSRYLEDVVNDTSKLVTVEDADSSTSIPGNLPDPQKLENGFRYLEKGVDGISEIVINDFIGESGTAEKKGMRCYEDVDEVCMVCIPDIMIQPAPARPTYAEPREEPGDPCLQAKTKEDKDKTTQPYVSSSVFEATPKFDARDILSAQKRMVEHCEMMKDRIAVLDSPFGADLLEIQEWRKNFDSKYAAIYYPWIRVDDPLRLGYQITRLLPPSGHIAGVFARCDLTIGVHKAPANEELMGAKDVDVQIDGSEQDILNPMGINCLRAFPGRGILVWGARTVSSDKSWMFISIRRLLIMIEESVEAAMQWAVFEPNDFHLRVGIRISVQSFLEELWRRGALAGTLPEDAYSVKCDEDNNPQEIIDAGKIITEISVAPSIPGEFIVFRIGRVEDRLEVIEES